METIREVICKNFTRLLDQSKLSQKVIAQAVGVSETTLYRWKVGENSPELDNIEELAKILNVNPFEFYRTDIEPIKLPMSEIAKRLLTIPDEVYDLAFKLGDLNDDQWINVRAALQAAIELKEERDQKSRKREA